MVAKLACRTCKDSGVVTEWLRTEAFSPNSPKQVLDLMRALKVRIPKKRGTDNDTTEAKYLKRLGRKHPVFKGILDVRQRGKLISNYCWPTDVDGTIRTVFGHHPSTWRKSSRKPNLQVIPRPTSDLNKLVRATVCAPPSWLLVEADSEGIEAVLVAYDVGDPLMMKVCKAGPHGFFMGSTQGRPIDPKLPFPELKAACKAEKKLDQTLYDVHKRCLHATHYGMSAYGMSDEYTEEFPTQAIAAKYQNAYLGLWPSLQQWMARIRQQAYEQRYLDNHFQYRMYFYDVLHWDGKRRQHVLGDDGKRCIAFKPQSDASAVQTEYMLAMQDKADAGDARYGMLMDWLRLLIHDSLVFMVPASEIAWVPQAIADVFNMPFAELGGLRIGVEVKVGPTMAEQSVVPISQIEWSEEEAHAAHRAE